MMPKSNDFGKALTEPICGAHHCVGSAHTILDLAFLHLHAACASHGGNLTESDLTTAHADIVAGFSDNLSYFEIYHQRCMDASGATAPKNFSRGRMLPSLLFFCSQRVAAHCFSLQFNRIGTDWLKLFFDAFSEHIRRHISADAEARLAGAYANAAGHLGQKLSIKKLLLEQEVQDVMRECIVPFRKTDACDELATEVTDEINHCIGILSGSVCPHVSKITSDQMRKFLNLFPHEVAIALK